ncbi:MAG: polyisoprenoid-binding protein [Desulfobulbaceae bacterium]|nr:YceI family protein [Desulfofustis sp.]RZW26142.1 MAG: polyisoprenoid-binding protein [Desulfobulbaceae bacterium]
MKSLMTLLLSCTIGLAPFIASAQAPVWEIDKDHTNFYFRVTHIYSDVIGRFKDYDGSVVFDPMNPEGSKMSFEIEVKSIDTGLRKRDKHLRSEDFLDASEYPLITFTSSSIEKKDDTTLELTGTLTIKDVSKQIRIPLSYAGTMDHPLVKNTEVAGFNGEITIDRLEYGVGDGKYYEMRVVDKDVTIVFTTEVMRKK